MNLACVREDPGSIPDVVTVVCPLARHFILITAVHTAMGRSYIQGESHVLIFTSLMGLMIQDFQLNYCPYPLTLTYILLTRLGGRVKQNWKTKLANNSPCGMLKWLMGN